MKINLNQYEDWDDYDLDTDNEFTIKKFPRENKTTKNYSKQAAIRKQRREKMSEREREEYDSYGRGESL